MSVNLGASSSHGVGVVWSCEVCHRGFDSRYALLGHVKAHKVKYARTSVRIPADEWAKFIQICRDHHSSTCHVIATLVKAFNTGAEMGVVNLATPNPVQIVISQTFLGRPRSPWKTTVAHSVVIRPPRPIKHPRHPECDAVGCLIIYERCGEDLTFKTSSCLLRQ